MNGQNCSIDTTELRAGRFQIISGSRSGSQLVCHELLGPKLHTQVLCVTSRSISWHIETRLLIKDVYPCMTKEGMKEVNLP